MSSHDVTAAILVFQNNETAAVLVYQDNPVGDEFFFVQTLSFVPINLHRCWPHEWLFKILRGKQGAYYGLC